MVPPAATLQIVPVGARHREARRGGDDGGGVAAESVETAVAVVDDGLRGVFRRGGDRIRAHRERNLRVRDFLMSRTMDGLTTSRGCTFSVYFYKCESLSSSMPVVVVRRSRSRSRSRRRRRRARRNTRAAPHSQKCTARISQTTFSRMSSRTFFAASAIRPLTTPFSITIVE